MVLVVDPTRPSEHSNVTIEIRHDWAPLGAQHFEDLVAAEFYSQARFFRIVPRWIAQFGIAGDPTMDAQWHNKNIQDEPVMHSNSRGTMSFAKPPQPNHRSTQLFFNLAENGGALDNQGFGPVGRVLEGMEHLDALYDSFDSTKVNQQKLHEQGNEYLLANWPEMSYIH
eukprot:CAMPEP_0182870534 /NCGR_PEP_ID=MMETSP0034_2-20130328/10584_1 /TAXON_ID=156128 /ORGANISM="Nephroselmis pyriformis, Strain CCMP717" /LENGTH=168 /DNA_ID=CAMNT_0025003035 /DNA_START=16 /DNA_END=519 /DNA_ORIENTATION=-